MLSTHRDKLQRTVALDYGRTVQSTVPKTCPRAVLPVSHAALTYSCANTPAIPCDLAGAVSGAKKRGAASWRCAHCCVQEGLAAARPPQTAPACRFRLLALPPALRPAACRCPW